MVLVSTKFFSQTGSSVDDQDYIKLEDAARYKGLEVKHEESYGNIAKGLADKSESVGLFVLSASSSSNWQKKKITEYVSINSNISVLVIPSKD